MYSFIIGNHTFIVSAFWLLWFKILTMVMCFMLSPFIAPVGLAYLCYHHSRGEPPAP